MPDKEADSQVVVMWPCRQPILQKAGVYVDGVERALLKRNRYARLAVSSGEHEVKFRFVGPLGIGLPATKATFTFKKGERHFIVFSYRYDMTGIVMIGGIATITGESSNSVVEVTPDEARYLMADMMPGELK